MTKRKGFITALLFFFTLSIYAQQPDTLIKKLDSLSKQPDTASGQKNNTAPSNYNEATKITFPGYFILLGSDLKQAFTKPFHMKKRDWPYLAGFAAVTAGIAWVDKPIQRSALKFRNDHPGIQKVSHFVTNFGGPYEVVTLGSLGLYGVIFKNEKMKTTTLLASQAYITGAITESVLKFISGRDRPYNSDPTAVQSTPTFHGPFYKNKTILDANGKKLNSSFPSGHTTVAFAAATVYAMEYKNKPLVPILAYSAASLIGLSRITENKHWASDVIVGAALGYVNGRLVVNNYHRYSQLKSPQQKKGTVKLNLQYEHGVIMPGFVYTFR